MGVFTTTSAVSHPPVGETGVVTVTDEADTDNAPPWPGPKSTPVTAPRFVPDNVTTVPPAAGPELTFIAFTDGQAFTGVIRSGTRAEAIGEPRPLARS